MSNKKSQSVAEKIADVLSSAPKFDDSDDEVGQNDLTEFEVGSDTEGIEVAKSSIRRKNADLLDDLDERYAGKKVSRIKEWDNEVGDISEEDVDSNDESEDEEENEDDEENSEQDENSDEDEESDSQDDGNFQHMSDDKKEKNKGASVKNQLNIWENLLEIRIQLQKCLNASNSLSQSEIQNVKEHNEVDSVVNSLKGALSGLLELQNVCVKSYPETKILFANKKENSDQSKNDSEELASDDEEIPSDTDEEVEPVDEEADENEPQRKKLKTSEYEQQISTNYNNYKKYRNTVIQKWNEKIHIGKSHSNFTVLQQIDHKLKDQEKLRKQCQLKRAATHEEEDEYCPDIYDDTEFYHQLLKELIEIKSGDVTDPVQLSQQWVKLQTMRSKLKRKIDTKATKGRKIRYTTHTKLVNWMPPNLLSTWTDEAKSELASSLFGKNKM